MRTLTGPLFVCHANCARSVLACHLYRHLCNNAPARSAGLEPGERISDRAEALLRAWGIDARAHVPSKLTRDLCATADAIFVMAPSYLHRMLSEYGEEYASKSYLFADPFSLPVSFANGEYRVSDPSFDERPIDELLCQLAWMRERVLQIRLASLGEGRPLVAASQYVELWRIVDRDSH
jgi:protein-tyrosine-phosphatase